MARREYLIRAGRYDPSIYSLSSGYVRKDLWPENYKSFYELCGRTNQMKMAMKRHDLVALRRSFRKTNKQLAEKVMSVIPAGKVPTLYIKVLVRLENYFSANKNNNNLDAEAFHSMKQKVERNNKKYDDAIARERENPAESDYEWDCIEELDVATDSEDEKTSFGPRKIYQTDRLMDWQWKPDDVSVDNNGVPSSTSDSTDEEEDDGETDSDMDYISDIEAIEALDGWDFKTDYDKDSYYYQNYDEEG